VQIILELTRAVAELVELLGKVLQVFKFISFWLFMWLSALEGRDLIAKRWQILICDVPHRVVFGFLLDDGYFL